MFKRGSIAYLNVKAIGFWNNVALYKQLSSFPFYLNITLFHIIIFFLSIFIMNLINEVLFLLAFGNGTINNYIYITIHEAHIFSKSQIKSCIHHSISIFFFFRSKSNQKMLSKHLISWKQFWEMQILPDLETCLS